MLQTLVTEDAIVPFAKLSHCARGDIYSLLAALLTRPPDSELLHRLRTAGWDSQLPASLIDAITTLRHAARKVSVPEIAREYNKLFVGLGVGEVVPYASWYLDGMLMSASLVRLRQTMGRLGLARQPQAAEAEDHAGPMCESMALLTNDPDRPEAETARFFREHVFTWMFDFFADVQKAPSARFYRWVARLGECMLALDRQTLSHACTVAVQQSLPGTVGWKGEMS